MEKISVSQIGIKPGVGSVLSYGWENMKKNFLYFFLVVFLLALLDIPFDSFRWQDGDFQPKYNFITEFTALAYFFLFLPVIEYGADLLFVHGVREQKIDFKTLIDGFNKYLHIILSHVLVFGLVSMAFIALIIPGIIVACRLVFVSYLIMDKDLEPIQAVEVSWKMTKGHAWKVFGLAVTSFFIIILGLICFIVGIFPAIMWIKASYAALYQSVLEERGDEFLPTPPAPVAA